MFFKKLIYWYEKNKRDLPWRHTKDPYKIWLSEVILQQTRVAQGLPYYWKFTEKYDTIFDLASDTEENVLRLWQGLGYYSRGRNLLATSKQIVNEYDGKFPETYIKLLKLKGVGQYTAAAIASFAYGEAIPVIDGNVLRYISRLYGITEPIDKPNTRSVIYDICKENIDLTDASIFNQAIMEYGALVCTPKNPDCSACVFINECEARKNKLTFIIPQKSKKVKVTERQFNYLVFKNKDQIFLNKRNENDIWKNLYDFMLIESKNFDLDIELEKLQISGQLQSVLKAEHKLTHQKLDIIFYEIEISKIDGIKSENGHWYTMADVNHLPKPIVIANFLEKI